MTVNSVKFITNQTVVPESKRDLRKCDALVAACFASEDYIEGRRAFMEKRKPEFQEPLNRNAYLDAGSDPAGCSDLSDSSGIIEDL